MRGRVLKRPSKASLKKDQWGVEGFMEEIPAVAIITFSVTFFMISAVSAFTIYLEDQARAGSLDRAIDISSAVTSYDPILIDGRPGHFSAHSLDQVQDGSTKFEIHNSGDMSVTISEKGGSNRSWSFGTTNRSDTPKATITRSVLVGYSADDPNKGFIYRIAFLEVRTW